MKPDEPLNWEQLHPATARNAGEDHSAPALPDAATIDPEALERPVLTQQGWLVPDLGYPPDKYASAGATPK